MTRSQKQWEWFTEIIRETEEADKKGLVENHIFITQFFDKFDLRTTMLVSGIIIIQVCPLFDYKISPFSIVHL